MHRLGTPDIEGRHVVFFNWRDTKNPEGGGSERYVESMARGLVARGARVTIFCAAHEEAPSDQVIDGVRYVRRGDHLRIYLFGLWSLLRRKFGKIDVVVDVQNGLPFFTRLGTRKPVVVLVHHVHREQWPVIFPGLLGSIGWWIESRIAPALYRKCQYITVSRATRSELMDLGVDRERIAVVHNGTTARPDPTPARTPYPSLVVVSRLVPHKQIEHAIDVVAAVRERHPEVHLTIVGSGWWEDDLHKYVATAGVADLVTLEGFVSEARKHEILASSWVMLLPSIKEGWGLVIGEAGSHEVPTIAYASAGGTRESIAHLRSGLLVETKAEFTAAVGQLLDDDELRARLGVGALEMSQTFSWAHSQESFAHVLSDVLKGRRVSVEDPDGP